MVGQVLVKSVIIPIYNYLLDSSFMKTSIKLDNKKLDTHTHTVKKKKKILNSQLPEGNNRVH